ncbi:hypothetical protein QUA87_22115 [Microcoleus sp. F6_C2]
MSDAPYRYTLARSDKRELVLKAKTWFFYQKTSLHPSAPVEKPG